jgi:hypothetical protein
MTDVRVSAINRVLYFTIPEQRIVYKAMKMYLEKHPENQDAQIIKEDFYRQSFE